jgi:hypothetical protein
VKKKTTLKGFALSLNRRWHSFTLVMSRISEDTLQEVDSIRSSDFRRSCSTLFVFWRPSMAADKVPFRIILLMAIEISSHSIAECVIGLVENGCCNTKLFRTQPIVNGTYYRILSGIQKSHLVLNRTIYRPIL